MPWLRIITMFGAIRKSQINRNHAQRSCWVRPWLRRFTIFGAFHTSLTQLSTEDPQSFGMLLRFDMEAFDVLLELAETNCYL